MPAQSTNSTPEQNADPRRAWAGQLRRDRLAGQQSASSDGWTLTGNEKMARAAALAKGTAGPVNSAQGSDGWTLTGNEKMARDVNRIQALKNKKGGTGPANNLPTLPAQHRAMDTDGRAQQGPITGKDVRQALDKAGKEATTGGQKNAVRAAKLATKIAGEDRIAELANAIQARIKKFQRFTLPSITMWRILLGEVFTSFVDFGAIHLYAAASFLGFKGYAPKKLAMWEWWLLVVMDLIIASIITLVFVLAVAMLSTYQCTLDVLCAIGLLKDFGSQFL
jgi:hypothetical protein